MRPFSTSGIPPKLALNRAYFDALETAGAEIVPIPILRDVSRLRFHYELLDALVLPGGADVEPRRYGAVARSDCGLYLMPELDEAEFTLLRWAIADGMPVLAICRGIQVLNVACGGTLWQDLHVEGATQIAHDGGPRDALVHWIEIESNCVLARALGETRVQVNSLHHQGIRDLGTGLRSVAIAEDGLTEGVELQGHRFVVGIQCHPEELGTHAWARRLFKAFVDAGAEFRQSRGVQEMHRSARSC